ncbi:MAG TPA: hypothetical protein VM578_01120 [Candidatus Saccharimonadales bacterium]|nr:hypothetical protein [Candidatus Saccharimonadales bacterium]
MFVSKVNSGKLISGTLRCMWWRYLKVAVLFVSTAFAQDRFVAVGSNVFRVSAENMLTNVLQSDPVETDLRFGSSKPRISADQQWIAYIKDNKAWLRPAGQGKPIQLAIGKDSDAQHLAIKVFLIGFTPDSTQLMYSVAAGKDECPDCRRPAPLRRQADYGVFLYTMREHRAVKIAVPGSTRILDVTSGNRLLITSVGAYGDVIGYLEVPSHSFAALPARCASASGCSRADNGIATCTEIGDDHSQIVECDSRSGSERAVSPQGSCITEFHHPSRSPKAVHLAYLQLQDRCNTSKTVLWIDQKPAFQCVKADDYGWVDENRLLVQCDKEFVAIDVTGTKLGSTEQKP